MSRRERVPRRVTSEGARLDGPYELGADPNGNRAQRRLAARGKRPAETAQDGSGCTEPPTVGPDAAGGRTAGGRGIHDGMPT